MRATFFNSLKEIYEKKSDMFILTADLGFKLFDKIKDFSPERFYDIGVAEANTVGIASGLSLCNKNVYCYSIAPFLIMRAYEQIRVDIDCHNLNVKLVAVGGGFTYGLEGLTHFGLEDLTLMKALQNMTVVVPADPMEASCLAKISYNHEGPMYIRLGRTGEPVIHGKMPDFKIGKAMILKEGKKVAVFAIGSMVHVVQQVEQELSKKRIKPTLINMHTLKPLDVCGVLEIAEKHDIIFSVEEHNVNGGLGSSLAEVLIENGYKGKFKRIGIPEKLKDNIGDAYYLRELHGLTPDLILKTILKEMQ